MKKITFLILTFSIYLTLANPTLAAFPLRRDIRNDIRNTVEDGKEEGSSPAEIKNEVKDQVKEDIKEDGNSIINRVKNFIKKTLKFDARITGTLESISGNTLSVKDDSGKTYTVNVTDKTQLRREFWGKSSLSEFSTGDKVNVIGKWTDSQQTTIDATLIRDTSIQKRWGVFFGKITAKNSDNFVMETVNRGSQTVVFGSAKFIGRNETQLNYSDVQTGDRVRVKGMWDKTSNKITEVNEVKDFSQPPLPTKTPEPTVTP